MTWRCVWCGREHETDDPPCKTCGHEAFEPVDESTSPFESESLVWVCENCGREHVKNAKICTRCSHPSLEKRRPETEFTDELSTPSYLSVGWPYLLGVAIVVSVVALALTGVIPVPGVGGPPAPPEAPGESERAAGLDLDTVEAELHARFAEVRAEEGADERTHDDGLDALATYLLAHEVASEHDPEYDGEMPSVREFGPSCDGELSAAVTELEIDPAAHDSEASLAEAIADSLLEDPAYERAVTDDRQTESVAIHIGPENTVYVSYLVC